MVYSFDKVSLLTLSILIVFLGASRLAGRSFAVNQRITNPTRIYKYFFLVAISLIFSFFVFQSFQQYWVWAGNELSKNLLPPYQSANYFIFYVFTRFFAPYLISLAAALVFLFLTKILNKKYGERFFEPEEFYLGASAIFLSGHPGWLFYVVFLLAIYVLIQLFSTAKSSILNSKFSPVRVSLYWLWIPTAIFVILIQRWLELLPIWQILKL